MPIGAAISGDGCWSVSVQVGVGDPFWEANARKQFPNVATAVDGALKDYKAAVAELHKSTGGSVPLDADPNQLMQVPPLTVAALRTRLQSLNLKILSRVKFSVI